MYLLSTLRSATPERHQKAIKALRDGANTVEIAYRDETEIRAIVTNGDGLAYGVTLSDRGNFCSCKDALYRNTTCKHQLALAVYVTQQGEALANVIHLWRRADLLPLCGEKSPKRFSQAWLAHIAANWPDCC